MESTVTDAAQPPRAHTSPLEALQARERRIVEALTRKRVDRNPDAVYDASRTLGQRVADTVASTMGSWRFIIIQTVLLVTWIVLNAFELITRAWDPYPFILLNLMLSFQAAYAAPIIMMSQNRQASRDRMQAELDLNTDLKAEMLIEELHGSMDELRIQKWAELLQIQQHQIELLQQVIQRTEGTRQAP
jgi:uncharacterized membrane protein